MNIQTEYHTTQKALFRRVNQIRNADGRCAFEEQGPGYRLRYCDSQDLEYAFIVQKGKDGSPFILYDGEDGFATPLENGDVLTFECEADNKVWFSHQKWLQGLDVSDAESDIGYTVYGSLSDMVRRGLIAPARRTDRLASLPLHPENAVKQQTPAMIDTVEIPVKTEDEQDSEKNQPSIFETLARLFKSNEWKNALDELHRMANYCSRKTGDYLRTHHVLSRSYFTGYSFEKGFQYTQAAQMRFGGRWLERAGFEYLTPVKIITMKDLIVILPAQQISST